MDKSRVEPTFFFIENISFSLKLFSGHFYGQSFIKTVRGPFISSKIKQWDKKYIGFFAFDDTPKIQHISISFPKSNLCG